MWALAGSGRRLCCAHALRATPSLCSAPAFPAARAGWAAAARWPGQAAAALSTAPAKLGPAEKSARAQARRDAEAAAKAEKKLLKRARYELAIAQPLLSDPRVCRLSLLDVPDYKRVKKGWKKGVVVSDKMDKTAKVLVERWGTAWNGKRVKLHTKYIAHDEGNVCRVGDVVYVSDSRPLSKTKHSVVQFNVGNPYELRDLDFDDPATIEAEDVRPTLFFAPQLRYRGRRAEGCVWRGQAAKAEAEARYEEWLQLQEQRAAAPRHKRILKRARRRQFGI